MEQEPHVPEPAAQPPGTAPPARPPVAGPGGPPSGAPPAQPPKSNRTLIIILVVVFLLLCSCCVIAAGAYLVYDDLAQEMDPFAGTEEPAEPTDMGEPPLSETALEEWLAWEPTTGEFEPVSPTARQQDIAQGAMAQIHPLFTIDEVTVDPGGYDEAEDDYYADEYVVLAHMTDQPEVEIFEQVYAPSAEGAADGDPSMDFEAFGEGYLLGTLDGGVEYVYPDDDNVLLEGPPEDIQQLLLVAVDQWPGGTVAIVFDDPDEEDAVWLALSTWEHVRTSWEFEGVLAKYIVVDGKWVLDEYEWTLPE